MRPATKRFYESIKNRSSVTDRDLISFFAYFLTFEQKEEVATAKMIRNCFTNCDLNVPPRLSAYLSEGLNGPNKRYIKTTQGYRLHRNFSDYL